ncbi:MAG: DNA primase catalytic subunit [Lentisphaeria bacterium]|jgi:DNA primase catalytic subunit
MSPFKCLLASPSLIGMRNNLNKEKLQDILSPDLYQGWQVLKKCYIGRSKKVEKFRSIFAAKELFDAAIKKSNLNSDEKIWKVIGKTIEKNKIEATDTGISRKIIHARKTIEAFKCSSLNDIECFERTIDRLEIDLKLMSLVRWPGLKGL